MQKKKNQQSPQIFKRLVILIQNLGELIKKIKEKIQNTNNKNIKRKWCLGGSVG